MAGQPQGGQGAGGQGGGMPQISPQSYTDLQNVFQYFQNNRGNAGGQTPMSNVAAPGGGGGLQTNTAPPASQPPAPPPPPAAPNPVMSGFNPMMRAPRQQQLSPRLQQLASQGQLNMFQPQIQPQSQPQPVQAQPQVLLQSQSQPQEANMMKPMPYPSGGPYGGFNVQGQEVVDNAQVNYKQGGGQGQLTPPQQAAIAYNANPQGQPIPQGMTDTAYMQDARVLDDGTSVGRDDPRFYNPSQGQDQAQFQNNMMRPMPVLMLPPQEPLSVGALTTQGGGIQRPDMSQVGGFAGPKEQQQPMPMSRKTLIPSMGRGVQIQGNPTAQPVFKGMQRSRSKYG